MIEINGYTEKAFCADFTHWTCSPPEPRRELVQVPFRNGQVDLYPRMGMPVTYGPRTITVELELRSLRLEWPMYYSKIMEVCHGREVQLHRQEDPDWYWFGLGSVGPLVDKGGSASVVITVVADPYKFKLGKLIHEAEMDSSAPYYYDFDKKSGYLTINGSVPEGIIQQGLQMTVNGLTYYIEAGGLDHIFVDGGSTLKFNTTYDDLTLYIVYEEVSL